MGKDGGKKQTSSNNVKINFEGQSMTRMKKKQEAEERNKRMINPHRISNQILWMNDGGISMLTIPAPSDHSPSSFAAITLKR